MKSDKYFIKIDLGWAIDIRLSFACIFKIVSIYNASASENVKKYLIFPTIPSTYYCEYPYKNGTSFLPGIS